MKEAISKGDSGGRPCTRPTEPPTRLGYYQLAKPLGVGNFAFVRLATHCITGSKVAVKIIDKTKLSQGDLSRLFREVQIMKQLSHPNVIRLYQVIESNQYLHLVSSYAENGELFDRISKNGRLTEQKAKEFFIQICRAMKTCHDRGIVHRDLKIENVLLDSNDNVKIADFGFGTYFKSTSSPESSGLLETFCGSPQYAAPEIFAGKSYDGFKTDVWSLGVILYVMVTGGQPFEGETVPEVKRSVLKGKFRVPYYISYDCENLIRSMLSMEPNKRPSVSSILSHKWIKADTSYREKNKEGRSTSLNKNILSLMDNIGIPKSKVIESYHSYLFNDFTAIYKLFEEQLLQRGSIDTKPIKQWLRCEVITNDEDSRPASPSPAPSSKRVINRPHSLEKVIHSARAFSAIFHKSGQDHEPHLSTHHAAGGKKNSKTSPLVSSLISPRRITDSGAHSPRFFNRTMFAFGPFSKSSSTSGAPANANLGSQSAR